MPERIRIEGDLVVTETYDILSEVRLEDLLPQIEHRPPVFIAGTPRTMHSMYWDESDPQNRRALILAELPPNRRQCRYERRRYTLAIPWTYFLYQFTMGPSNDTRNWMQTDSRVFWAREEVTGLDSMIGRALVPNCSANGSICYGTTQIPATLPLRARVDRLTSEFYATTFMHDSGAGSPWGSETGSTNWARWHTESENDPLAWQRFPEWGRDGHPGIPMQTLRELLESAVGEVRPTTIEVTDRIPDMVMPMTFGRAEEWARRIDPMQRFRLRRALQIIEGEDPDAIQAPVEVAPEDPGGEEIPDDE